MAFVVPVESVSVTAEDIGAYAESIMPNYMRPRHIRVVEELPRTPTNKIEKYKLRAQITGELLAHHGA